MPLKRHQLNIKIKNFEHESLSAEQAERLDDAIQRGNRALLNVFVRAIKNSTLIDVKKNLPSNKPTGKLI